MTVQTSLPSSSAHLSGFDRDDMIEQYAGVVDAQIAKSSIMRKFVDMQSIRGTDTKTVRRMGDTVLQGIRDDEAGQEITALPRKFDRAQVTVDTIIAARDSRGLLNEFQTDFSARREIGIDHGKTIAKFFDAALLSMGVKTALSKVTAGVPDAAIQGSHRRNLGDAFKSGHRTELTTAQDELDPDALYTAFEKVIVEMQENDIDTDETALFVRPRQHAVLLNNDKLINRKFSLNNGDFAEGVVKTIMNVPVVSTARLADAGIDLSILSRHKEYVPSDYELTCVGLIMHPNSLLGGETIPLTSDVHYEKTRFSWFIDSYLAFGAAPRRPDCTGAVFKLSS